MKVNVFPEDNSFNQEIMSTGENFDAWVLCKKESDPHPAHGEDVWLCFDWYPNKVGSYFNYGKEPERRIEKARWFLTYWEVNGCKAENIAPIMWTRCTNKEDPEEFEAKVSLFSDDGEIISHIKLPDGKIYKIAQDKEGRVNSTVMFADDNMISEVQEFKKPPLGITPRWLHNEKRMHEILDGMERYSQEQKVAPFDWIAEAKEIFTYLMSKKGHENG